MKKALAFLLVILSAGILCAQQTPVPTPNVALSFSDGTFYAPNFGKWQLQLAAPITATGSVAFLVNAGTVVTPDGITFVPFAVNEKISIGLGVGVQEIVTVTGVSGCNAAAVVGNPAVCTVTATVANLHSTGEPINSADSGTMEAVAYASNTGGGQVYFLVDCGQITLNTGGLTTTSTCFVPNQFYNSGGAARVTTTITVTASWAVGIVNNTSTFTTANSTLTAGTTSFANTGTPAVALVTGATAANLTAVLITGVTSNPGAGVVHVKVWGTTAAPPAF